MFGIALLLVAAGWLLHARLSQAAHVHADSDHVFELMVYHVKPGKAGELQSIFRDVSQLQSKHHLNAVGYWLPAADEAPWKDSFVYLVEQASRAEATSHWNELHADPAFLPYRKAAAPLIEQVNGKYQVDEVFMQPTEYSRMR